MLLFHFYCRRILFLVSGCLFLSQSTFAQTDADAIMIPKKYFCTGAMYSYGSWKQYWEGNFKRENLNIGRLSTQMYTLMGNYGISSNLNVLVGLPYVITHASGGTLKGMKGIQDLAITAKWKALKKKVGGGSVSVFALAGVSLPATDYIADFLPMSIGLHSKNVWLRGMVDYQAGHFFATASAVYVRRSNVTIDRTAYYTTEMHYTNEVKMPDTDGFNVRSGFRSRQWIAEAVFERSNTLGGFDIRKNDMPFLSNKMNSSRAGINLKYTFRNIKGLEVTGGSSYVVRGRNVGQATMVNCGAFYIMNLSKKKKSAANNQYSQS